MPERRAHASAWGGAASLTALLLLVITAWPAAADKKIAGYIRVSPTCISKVQLKTTMCEQLEPEKFKCSDVVIDAHCIEYAKNQK